MGILKNKKKFALRWESFDNLEDRRKQGIFSTPFHMYNHTVFRIMTRSELESIPRDRYIVNVLNVRIPRQKTGEAEGDEELLVAITTNAAQQTKLLQNFRYRYRALINRSNGGGGGEPPCNPFHDPINQNKMADCIIQVMDNFFHGEEQCTICDKEYSRMEFCVLMHIFFKKINFMKKESRLQFSKFVQNKVLAGKSGFVRTYNTYADKDIYKDFEKELDISQCNFKFHPMPVPPDKKPSDYHQRIMLDMSLAFQEIGWVFQNSPYFTELKELRKTVNQFVLQ